LFTVSYGVFIVLVTPVVPLSSKERSLGSGLSLADEVCKFFKTSPHTKQMYLKFPQK